MKSKSALPTHSIRDARILIVDDEPANVRLLQSTLDGAGYTQVRGTSEPNDVAPIFAEAEPDIVLLDLHMPGMDGFAVLELLSVLVPRGAYLPVIVITGDESTAVKERALAAGAMDFVGKPFKVTEVLLRIRNLLQTRCMYLELRDRNEHLDQLVRERTKALEDARVDILFRLAAAAEYHDDATGRHTRRVGRAAALVAAELGLPADDVAMIELAGMLHDVGKIGVPDAILLKPGRLTDHERKVIRTHTTIGQRLLAGSTTPMMRMAEEIALHHHERWDGNGYHRRAGSDIPIAGRIAGVVDVFDALTHERPYRPAFTQADVFSELHAGRGSHFDPLVFDGFMSVLERVGFDFLVQDCEPVMVGSRGAALSAPA